MAKLGRVDEPDGGALRWFLSFHFQLLRNVSTKTDAILGQLSLFIIQILTNF